MQYEAGDKMFMTLSFTSIAGAYVAISQAVGALKCFELPQYDQISLLLGSCWL